MTILALDQASRTSGYAVFCEDQLIDSGKFTYEDADLAERLVKIRKKVETLIDYFHIEKIILEDIQLQNNVGSNVVTYKALAEVIGVLTELAAERKLPYELVSSSSWKSLIMDLQSSFKYLYLYLCALFLIQFTKSCKLCNYNV